MRRLSFLLFSLGLLIPAAAKASPPDICPWLTKGTAEAALRGSVSARVQVATSGEGSCTFSLEEGDSKDTLRIVVQKADLPTCPAGSPKLLGIGNEAVRCTLQRSAKESVQMIVSRVREMHFNVSITTHKPPSATPAVDRPDDALEQVAETVAGNLF